MSERGLFVTLEGAEGCGKTTVCNLLKTRLPQALFYREPGSTKIGEAIRGVIMGFEPNPRTEILLFEAARAALSDVIKSDLAQNKLVICDRFFDSSTVFQGLMNNFNLTTVEQLNLFATGGLIPEITFFIDIDPRISVPRKFGCQDTNRLDFMPMEKHLQIWNFYHQLAKENDHQRWVILDGNQTPDQLAEVIIQTLQKRSQNLI